MKINTVILSVLLCLCVLQVYAGSKEENKDASDEAFIWDVYMEYKKWCKENEIKEMTYNEWESIREEMKNNPDAVAALLSAKTVTEENSGTDEQQVLEQTEEVSEDTGLEPLVFSSPEEEELYNSIKEYYNSLSEKEKEFLKRIISEEGPEM